MLSPSLDVDAYLASAAPERRPALTELRALCLERLSGFTEVMAHGMPGYERDGVGEVSFASQKQYISLYVMRTDVMAAHGHLLEGQSVGRSCIRYRRPEQIDMALVASMLDMTASTRGPVH